MNKLMIAVTLAVLLALLAGCAPATTPAGKGAVQTPEAATPGAPGLFLGLTPPGRQAVVFAPGVVSIEDGKEYKIAISPDLQEVFFTRRTPGKQDDRLWHSRMEDGKLSTPVLAPFAYDALESDACFTQDGDRVYFNSRRPTPGQTALSSRLNLWFVEREGDGWGEAQFLDSRLNDYRPVYCSIAEDGTMYFTRSSPRQIWYAELVGGQYAEAQALPGGINRLPDVAHPAAAPDESYVIVDSYQEKGGRLVGALYVSFRLPDGVWSQALSLAQALGASETDVYASARVSPDGKYLFFESYLRETDQADIYWVSTEVLDELRRQALGEG
ncbi:MAG: hypothetical protein AB1894_20825 [Chloroflexota bacterium]